MSFLPPQDFAVFFHSQWNNGCVCVLASGAVKSEVIFFVSLTSGSYKGKRVREGIALPSKTVMSTFLFKV